MLKRVLLLLLVAVFSLSTSVLAAAKVEQNAAAGVSVAAVMERELTMVSEMFAGFDTQNYERFSKDFDPELKKIFTPDVFKSAHKDTISKLGSFKGMDILIWQAGIAGAADTIIYRGNFASDGDMLITVSLDRQNPTAIKINRVFFESPLLDEK